MGADVVSMLGHGDARSFVQAAGELTFVANAAAHPHEEIERMDEGGTPAEFLVQIGVDTGERRLIELVQLAAEKGFHIHEVSVAKPSLGDVFLAHTGHELRD